MRAGEELVYSSLPSLIRQQAQISLLQLAKRHALAKASGQRRSVFKGRGMDFAESRLYQPGDDIRSIDWRVTARTGRVHTKVFQEERERPVLLWVDLRSAMFFATRGRFKSVVAAEVASLLLWKTLDEGDRIGGMIQSPLEALEFKPARNRSAALEYLNALADVSQAELASTPYHEPLSVADSWQRLRRVSEPGAQVYVLSDFREVGALALQQLAIINRHSQVCLISIHDPFEEQLPTQGHLKMTDGQHSLWVNLKQRDWREDYQQRYQQTQAILKQFARQHRMPFLPLSTHDSTRERLRILSRGLP